MPNVHVTPIVGLPQFSGWSHVIEGTHSSPHRFVAVLSVSGKQASNVGRDVASLLLAETINSSEELYRKLLSAVDLCQLAECDLAIGAALVSENKTIFAVRRAAVFLRRHTKIGTILQSNGTLKLIEGNRMADDIFALVTEQATQFLGEIELKSKQGYDVDTIITSIVPGVHAQADSSLSAFAFVTQVPSNLDTAEYEQHALEETVQSEFGEDDIPEEVTDVTSEAAPETAEPQQPEKPVVSSKNLLSSITPFLMWTGAFIASILQWLWMLLQWLVRTMIRFIQTSRGVQEQEIDSPVEVAYNSPVRQRRAKLIILAIIVVVVLVIGVISYLLRARSQELTQAESLVAPLRTQITAAQAQVETQPVEARDQVQRVIQELDALQATHSEQKRMVAVFQEEQNRARQVFDSISGQEVVDALPVFYDLRLVKSDFVTTHTTQVGGTAVFLDAEQRQLISLNLEDKSPRLFSLDEATTITALAGGSEDEIFLLNGGIVSLSLVPDAKPETIKAEGDSTRGGTLIGTFDRFLYVFNPSKRNLYRYAKQDNGYSDPIGWLQVSRGLDYGTVTSMTIDGDIWLGSTDGSIRKFTSGVEQELTISGLPQTFDSAVQLFTTEELEHLYVLESSRNRIVILSKSGEFLRELTNQSLGAATGLLVQESLNTAFAVSGATVFAVAL